MEAVGIIAEYNPFHNGHLHHLQQAKKNSGAEAVVCVISGNFTQRGEAALFDKWKRASLAIECGVDLVIELPFVFAVRSAQEFARGGVRLLSQLPGVKTLAFGCEHADLSLLKKISQAALAASTADQLRLHLKAGHSYARSLATALHEKTGVPEALLKDPNTILSVEYLNAIEIFQTGLKPLPIERIIARYHDTEISAPLASATAIRREVFSASPAAPLLQMALPVPSFAAISAISSRKELPSIEYLLPALLSKLRTASAPDLRSLYGFSEGIEHKFLAAALKADSLAKLLELVKSRRYPLSRLQRTLLYLLLDLKSSDTTSFDEAGPLYARVLGANKTGCRLLHQLKGSCSLPLITKTTEYLDSVTRQRGQLNELQKMLAFDTKATDIYDLCFATPHNAARDFTTPPYITR
ncbi:MAG: nucleotidyltransferase [Selenomonadaceae bacterium]|jgi:Predicted nucleotidyltransferase